MEITVRERAIGFIQTLIDCPLLYAIKSPDTELYDFGFGELVDTLNRQGKRKKIGTHMIHALCRFKVIWKNGSRRVDRYFEDTPYEVFFSDAKRFVGLKVLQVALSDKNDLWLDLGDYWIVFATYENGEESWRLLTSNRDIPHMVASDAWLRFDD